MALGDTPAPALPADVKILSVIPSADKLKSMAELEHNTSFRFIVGDPEKHPRFIFECHLDDKHWPITIDGQIPSCTIDDWDQCASPTGNFIFYLYT